MYVQGFFLNQWGNHIDRLAYLVHVQHMYMVLLGGGSNGRAQWCAIADMSSQTGLNILSVQIGPLCCLTACFMPLYNMRIFIFL